MVHARSWRNRCSVGELAPELIGRERETAALTALFVDRTALPAALVIAGDPGIGKTRVLQEGLEIARAESFRVLQASPTEMEARLSFAALGDMLDTGLEQILEALPQPQRRNLAVALLREELEGPPPDQRAVALAFLEALRRMADSGPLAIVVDDVQWLDAPSSFTLGFALRRLRTEPVAILFGLRLGSEPTMQIGNLLPNGLYQHLALAPLTLVEVQQLLRTRLDLNLSRPALRRLHRLCGGNAFYALEVGRAFQRGALTLEADEPIPRSVAVLVDDRLSALPATSRAALLAASTLSHPTVSLVRTMLGDGSLAGLEAAREAHVIDRDSDRVWFTHPLLRSAAYAAASDEERAGIHRRAAAAMSDDEERARHLALSASGPDRDVAAALEAAALHADRRGALATAADLAAMARRVTPPDDRDGSLRRTILVARYQFDLGDLIGGRALIESAIHEAPIGWRRAEALYWHGRSHHFEGDRLLAVKIYLEALDQAQDDVSLQVRLHNGLADAYLLLRTNLRAAAEHGRLAVDLAGALGNRSALVEALAALGLVEMLVGSRDWRPLLSRAVEVAGERDLIPDRAWLAGSEVVANASSPARALGGESEPSSGRWFFPSYATFNLAVALTWADEVDDALSILRAVRDKIEMRGEDSALPWTLAQLSLGEYLVGRWSEAARLADEAIELADQLGQESQQLFGLGVRALIRASQGLDAGARADATFVRERADERGIMVAAILAASAIGVLELSLGRPKAAHAALGGLFARLQDGGVTEPGSMRFVGDEIEALIELHQLDEAESMLRWLERRARDLDRRSSLVAAGRCRGLLLAARGELQPGLRALEAAAGEAEALGRLSFEHARTLLALGRLRRRARMKRPAREALEMSALAFGELGARLWAEVARSEADRVGGRPPSTGELTPTERRIIELVIAGNTDREVADILYVTPKTIGTQLSRIYRKLDVHSRTSLAAWRTDADRDRKV